MGETHIISEYVCRQYDLCEGSIGRLEYVNPKKLLCPERLDIAAKYLYLKYKDKESNYATHIYSEHIRAMTKGSYVEPYSDKKSIRDFILCFEELYKSMCDKGYGDNEPIPVDTNYRIMDGAHRVAIALLLKEEVPVVVVPVDAKYDVYNQSFFEKAGVDENVLDAIVRTYVELKDDVLCINIWPSAIGHEAELHEKINKYFEVIYEKKVSLNENGALYYLAQIYSEYSWAQNNNDNFSGVYRKLLPCFPNFNPVKVLFVQLKTKENLVVVKEELRSIFEIGKHSLHITDNQDETIQMGKIVLNNNSVDFINKADAIKYKNTFLLIQEAIDKKKTNDNIAFTGSVVLALYGIREAYDLDYITNEPKDATSHNEYIYLYGKNVNELLYNPNNQFYFFDCPFLLLNIIKDFKNNRNEEKDKDDIILIDLIINQTCNKSKQATYIRVKRRVIARIQGCIIRLAHLTGTYEIMRKAYKWIKEQKK